MWLHLMTYDMKFSIKIPVEKTLSKFHLAQFNLTHIHITGHTTTPFICPMYSHIFILKISPYKLPIFMDSGRKSCKIPTFSKFH